MVVPEVSQRNWERTRALSQIVMGTRKVDASELSFRTQLEQLLEDDPEAWREVIEEGGAYHGDWPDGVRVKYEPADGRPHRPEVPAQLVEELDELAELEYPGVPVGSLPFEERLDLVLDSFEEVYREVGCEIVPVMDEEPPELIQEALDSSH